MNECVIKRWVEPLLTILAGSALAPFNQALGGWLVFAGMCLGVTETLAAMRFRTMILDMIDKDIEARNLRAALIEPRRAAEETEGFVLPIGNMKPQQRASIFRGLAMRYEEWRAAYAREQRERQQRQPEPSPPPQPQEPRPYYITSTPPH